MDERRFVIDESYDDLRIDKYLSILMPDMSRSYLQKIIKNEAVSVNQKPVKASTRISTGDTVLIRLPEPVKLDIEAEDIPLDIVYEDEDLLVINKPKDMVVHPAPGHYSGTIVNAVMHHCGDQLSSINGVLRPGIVHRIDKDTTGLIVICKNDTAHQAIADQLAVHSITRAYRAIVWHNIKEDEGTVNAPIGRMDNDRKKMCVNYQHGRDAVTHYRVLERFGRYTYIECRLETGRTHQIRVHMTSIGHPLLGDEVYGPAKSPFKTHGQVLHAMVLGFIHPRTGEYMEFSAPLPDEFEKILASLRQEKA